MAADKLVCPFPASFSGGMMLFLFAQAADPLSGGAGWVGAGLLGLVMAWIFFVRWPANDKQTKDLADTTANVVKVLLEMSTTERDKESRRGQDALHSFQEMVSDMQLEHRKDIAALLEQHRADADKDRLSFEKRHDSINMAIEKQTSELRLAIIAGSCKFRPGDHACPAMVHHDTQGA